MDNELSSLLEDIKNRLDLIENKIQNVSGDLFDLAENFPEFEEMAGLIGRSVILQLNVYSCITEDFFIKCLVLACF